MCCELVSGFGLFVCFEDIYYESVLEPGTVFLRASLHFSTTNLFKSDLKENDSNEAVLKHL